METFSNTSPYPGLRPFTESESLYFKGREHHILKIQQELSQKRFLMVTGASGDGKSSLIYAGLLPNVVAGFFRGDLGRWSVAVFRPGHQPMNNLCEALGKCFKEKTEDEIKEKLRYGYSALAELYKASSKYLDTTSESYKALDEKEQKKARRSAHNLLIVVDQFEEFFTSDENFNKETAVPGLEAQLVMNLLLETTRISKEKGLPVYIVCTMRSDYIGSAPSYRGLPELIGDNQFFVPRLNREEISKVIEEPAELNGNKISKRLVQRLINDLDVVNTDVLPSLQHALRRIWELAEKGTEELDLLHYAKAGGMDKEELPGADKSKFEVWYNELPEYHKHLHTNDRRRKGISNILNHHADVLFETAHMQDGIKIEKEQAQQIIKKFFQCLTQIDESKAVRHRKIFGEALEIINDKKTESTEIEKLLRIYREQGNNFIYPFIEKEQINPLEKTTLLDITHEALIRNWTRLMQWTKEEHDKARDLKELNTSLERWIKEKRKKEYLLSSGTYEYFIKRYPEKLPSAAWMQRYIEDRLYITDGRVIKAMEGQEELSKEVLFERSMQRRRDLKEFLSLSQHEIARKKKLRQTVVGAISALMIIAVIGFIWAYSTQKQIAVTASANNLATTAYTMLEHDPTQAFRLAEESYKIEPTPLNQQVIMASYAQMPFYQKFTGHTDMVCYAEYSPDGKYFVTASFDNTAIIWNSDGSVKARLNHNGPLPYQTKSAIFSPDGKLILICSLDSTARLWNLDGKCLSVMKSADGVKSICFSPDGTQILTGSYDKTARLWDFNGKELMKMNHEKRVTHVDFLEAGKKIITVTDILTIWDYSGKKIKELKGEYPFYGVNTYVTVDGKTIFAGDIKGNLYGWKAEGELLFKKKGHESKIWWIDVSSDEKFIVTGSEDKNIGIWDIDGNLLKTLRGHSALIWMVKFSPDNKKIISASDDGTARLWDLEGKEIMVLKGHTSQIFSAQFSPDGKKAVTASGDGTVRIWDIDPKENPIFKGHTGYVMDASFSLDGTKIITAGFDLTARLWDKNGKQEHEMEHKSYYAVTQAISDDEKIYTNNKNGNEVIIWNKKGKPTDTLKTRENIQQNGLNISDNQKKLMTTEGFNTYIFNKTNKEIQILNGIVKAEFILKEPNSGIESEFPNSKYIFTINTDSSIQFLTQKTMSDTGRYQPVIKIKIKGTSFSTSSFSFDNKWMVTASEDSTIKIWDLEEILRQQKSNGFKMLVINNSNSRIFLGKRPEIKVNASITNIIFSPIENSFISISDDNVMRLWNSNGELQSEFTGHSDAINDVNFSKDGQFIVSGSNDKTVRLWDVSTSLNTGLQGKELMVYTGHKAAVMKAKFSPDGKYILSASMDQTARLMPVNVESVLGKINKEKVRGDVYKLSEADKKVHGIK